jgi:hypothetical protein
MVAGNPSCSFLSLIAAEVEAEGAAGRGGSRRLPVVRSAEDHAAAMGFALQTLRSVRGAAAEAVRRSELRPALWLQLQQTHRQQPRLRLLGDHSENESPLFEIGRHHATWRWTPVRR